MKAEYKEGPEARENFEKLAYALFQVPATQERKPTKKRQPLPCFQAPSQKTKTHFFGSAFLLSPSWKHFAGSAKAARGISKICTWVSKPCEGRSGRVCYGDNDLLA